MREKRIVVYDRDKTSLKRKSNILNCYFLKFQRIYVYKLFFQQTLFINVSLVIR